MDLEEAVNAVEWKGSYGSDFSISRQITDEDGTEQVRALIHWFLAHEADENIYFGGERPFYPHNADGSVKVL